MNVFLENFSIKSFAFDFIKYELCNNTTSCKYTDEQFLKKIIEFKSAKNYNIPESICAYAILNILLPETSWPVTELGKEEVLSFVKKLEKYYNVIINENIIIKILGNILSTNA
jgi:hypothetical protein